MVEDVGVIDTSTEFVLGVAEAVFDGSVEPAPIFAETANEYVLSVSRLLTI